VECWRTASLLLTSLVQELFGPLSLQALEKDQYVRQIKGYLPDASVAFIDEVLHPSIASTGARPLPLTSARHMHPGVQGQQRGAELAAHHPE